MCARKVGARLPAEAPSGANRTPHDGLTSCLRASLVAENALPRAWRRFSPPTGLDSESAQRCRAGGETWACGEAAALAKALETFALPCTARKTFCRLPRRMPRRQPLSKLENTTMPTGTVKWFNATKGYGFIEPEDGSKDAFVHISAVERAGLGTLREGQKVRFEVRPGRDGKSSAEELSVVE